MRKLLVLFGLGEDFPETQGQLHPDALGIDGFASWGYLWLALADVLNANSRARMWSNDMWVYPNGGDYHRKLLLSGKIWERSPVPIRILYNVVDALWMRTSRLYRRIDGIPEGQEQHVKYGHLVFKHLESLRGANATNISVMRLSALWWLVRVHLKRLGLSYTAEQVVKDVDAMAQHDEHLYKLGWEYARGVFTGSVDEEDALEKIEAAMDPGGADPTHHWNLHEVTDIGVAEYVIEENADRHFNGPRVLNMLLMAWEINDLTSPLSRVVQTALRTMNMQLIPLPLEFCAASQKRKPGNWSFLEEGRLWTNVWLRMLKPCLTLELVVGILKVAKVAYTWQQWTQLFNGIYQKIPEDIPHLAYQRIDPAEHEKIRARLAADYPDQVILRAPNEERVSDYYYR